MPTIPGSSPPEGADGAPGAETVPEEPTPAPPARPSSHDRTVEAALAASTRAEATLGALHQAIQQFTQGVSGAREANDQLAAELHRVREMLEVSNEQRLVFENQVELLEQQLREARGDREFLIEEQDRFLLGLLEEHEQTVTRVLAERDEAFERLEQQLRQVRETPTTSARRTNPGLGDASPPVPSVRPAPREDIDKNVEKLLAERERSREVLRRLQQQRDEAQQALAEVTKERDRYLSELARIAPGRVAVPRQLISPEDARRTVPAVPHLATRTTDPSPPEADGIGERMTAPPGTDLSAVIALSRPSPPAGIPAVKWALKRKPDPTSQPLGGYSLQGGADADEEGDE